tara:strand:+ start:2636 stop:2812 length:177 start_codon:yes stop_codon:yes gene_type:complete
MVKFQKGDTVKHKVFGLGEVQIIDGFGDNPKLTILFDDIDERKIIKASYVKLLKEKRL